MAEQHLDLIDRQALLAKKTEIELCFAVSEYDIANAPKVDAVEVVRCKDCKKISPSVTPIKDAVWCREFRAYMPCDGFCSYGERRNDG